MSRREAAELLHWNMGEVDKSLIPLENYPAALGGKMRYQVMVLEGDLRVRILAADVFAMVPAPALPAYQPERPAPRVQV